MCQIKLMPLSCTCTYAVLMIGITSPSGIDSCKTGEMGYSNDFPTSRSWLITNTFFSPTNCNLVEQSHLIASIFSHGVKTNAPFAEEWYLLFTFSIRRLTSCLENAEF